MGWKVDIVSAGVQLALEPMVDSSEVPGAALPVTYWEGEVTAKGTRTGVLVTGIGFVKLAG